MLHKVFLISDGFIFAEKNWISSSSPESIFWWAFHLAYLCMFLAVPITQIMSRQGFLFLRRFLWMLANSDPWGTVWVGGWRGTYLRLWLHTFEAYFLLWRAQLIRNRFLWIDWLQILWLVHAIKFYWMLLTQWYSSLRPKSIFGFRIFRGFLLSRAQRNLADFFKLLFAYF